MDQQPHHQHQRTNDHHGFTGVPAGPVSTLYRGELLNRCAETCHKVAFAGALTIYTPTLSLPLETRGRELSPLRMGSILTRRYLAIPSSRRRIRNPRAWLKPYSSLGRVALLRWPFVAVVVLLTACASNQGTTGLVDNRFAPCPDKPNCVSSDAADDKHRVEPYRLKAGARDAWHGLQNVVATEERMTLIEVNDRYLHIEVLVIGGIAGALTIYTPTLSLPPETRGRELSPLRMGSILTRRYLAIPSSRRRIRNPRAWLKPYSSLGRVALLRWPFVAVVVLLTACASNQGTTGLVDNRFAPCPDKPNCVSSDAADDKHRVEPYRLKAGGGLRICGSTAPPPASAYK